MRYFTVLLFAFITFSLSSQDTLSKGDKIKAYLDEIVQKKECMGIAAAYSENGTTKWSSTAGYSNKEKGKDFQTNTVSRIASISKSMTAIAILQLIEKEKLSFDDKVSDYLPEFDGGDKSSVTVLHLLQHTSGIENYKNKKEQNNCKEYKNLQEALSIFIKRDLAFEPGTEFEYTSYGFVVLGRIIEKASGLSYQDYMKKFIFDPLEMNHTSIESYNMDVDNKSKLYHKSKPGKIKEVDGGNISDRIPGGGIQSTMEDLIKFGDAVLNHTLISKESLDKMTKDHGLKKEGNAYGMGWYIYRTIEDRGFIFGHNGAQMGTSCWLLLLPEKNRTVVVLSNTSGALQETFNTAWFLLDLEEEK